LYQDNNIEVGVVSAEKKTSNLEIGMKIVLTNISTSRINRVKLDYLSKKDLEISTKRFDAAF
jgi:hypothetical protein